MIKNNPSELSLQVLTLDELVKYTSYKKGYIYQLIHKRAIPAHKPPKGKKLFFSKNEIDEWLLSRKLETVSELKFNLKNKRNVL